MVTTEGKRDIGEQNENASVPLRVACAARARLGEGPVYLPGENALYWVDIKGKEVHRLCLSRDAHHCWPMPETIGWILPRQNAPGFIAGLRSGFAKLRLDPVSIEPIGAPESHLRDNRLNDAAVDRSGCIWAGSMDDREQADTGALYRLDPDGSWTRHDAGYVVSNGPTFSPDHDILYHADTTRRVVYRFRREDDGSLRDREVFVTFEEDWGFPDGMATDEEGGVWIAHWGGARLSRFLPDGSLSRVIRMPVSQVTKCCFAGADLRRMFVTTASIGRENEPQAGFLFEVSPGVRGAPCYSFNG
jgi:sugar lactone lactonase YvrE